MFNLKWLAEEDGNGNDNNNDNDNRCNNDREGRREGIGARF
jgi:hypothetical protein